MPPHDRQRAPRELGPRGSIRIGEHVIGVESVIGEIPWRNMHVENCTTCGKSTDSSALFCSNPCHLNIRTHMTSDQPGVYREEISRTIPLRKEDEE